MKFFNPIAALAIGALAVVFAGAAGAQENLDLGKTPAQLYASDCAICHKTPAGLSKGRILGLESFLREHYTASRETAAAIAAYVQAMDKGPAAPAAAKPAKRNAKGDDKKPGDAKSGDTKPGDAKSTSPKSTESKPADAKPADSKPAEAKPAETKPAEAKPAEPKPAETKPADSPKSD